MLSHLVSYLLETRYAGSCLGQVTKDLSKVRESSVILCCSMTLNSGCECRGKAISYISLVNFDIIWKFFVYVDFSFFQ